MEKDISLCPNSERQWGKRQHFEEGEKNTTDILNEVVAMILIYLKHKTTKPASSRSHWMRT